ncbi:hypothetical protein [Okeania sp. SIO1I7]|uniref:hypothetical protein n=1 Tax=Okeania sp. SIO1I7 TaxID=2607772 RepID=UPI0013F8A287|nr:hypothetical protein [Okeania sp. SIO1I7]NET26852.1 hypothetical protein [Okeania sp. SIO1I7]
MGEGRRQPTPRPSPSQPTPNPSPPGRGRQEEWGTSEEVGVTIVNLGFFCPTMRLKY